MEHPENNRKNAAESGVTLPRLGAPTVRRNWLLWGLVGLMLLAAGIYFSWDLICRSGLWDRVCHYVYLLEDKEKVKRFLKAAGPLAPLVFISVQALQVVMAPIPGEATGFIGGYLFGVPLGMLYSTIGLTLGSIMAFGLGRWLEHKFVERVVSRETLERFDFLMERQGALIAFFLFVVPGFPKDYLCFILGLSLMSWKLFLLLSTVGRLPGTLMLTLQGAKVYDGNYLFTGVLIVSCLALAGALYYFREPLYQWLRRWDQHPQAAGPRDRGTAPPPGGTP
jgi:uncharacterized membrane protein YdjX (TVP38/TMEM64 family)